MKRWKNGTFSRHENRENMKYGWGPLLSVLKETGFWGKYEAMNPVAMKC